MSSTRLAPYVLIICLITVGFLTTYVATVTNYMRQIEDRDRRINALTYEVALLTKENRDLRSSIEILNNYVLNLTIEINSLRRNYNDLLGRYGEAIRGNKLLEEKYVDLSIKYNDTLTKLRILEDIVNLRKNKTLISFVGAVSTNHTLLYRLDYAGYVKITFKSNTSLYILVENRIGDKVFVTRIPIDAFTDSGEFLIPVAPGQLILRFVSEMEEYFSIKYEVIYVY